MQDKVICFIPAWERYILSNFYLNLSDNDELLRICLTKSSRNIKKQQELLEKIKAHDKADENFFITVNTVLSLAQRALEIFNSSEVTEKRQILNFLLQNTTLKDKKLHYIAKNTV